MENGKKKWGKPKGSGKGVPLSEEHKRKISEKVRAAYLRWKAEQKEGV